MATLSRGQFCAPQCSVPYRTKEPSGTLRIYLLLILSLLFVSNISIADELDSLDDEQIDEIAEDDLPPAEEYVDPKLVKKNRKGFSGAIGDSELGSENDYQTLGEYQKSVMEHCRYHQKDPQCLEYKGRLRKRATSILDICKTDPLNERCQKYRRKKFNDELNLERLCTKDPKNFRCMRNRNGR